MLTKMKYESKTKMLSKGTVCVLSERRGDNMVYPSGEETTVLLDAIIDELSWAHCDGLQPIAIDSMKLANPPWSKTGRKIIVWINPKDVLRF